MEKQDWNSLLSKKIKLSDIKEILLKYSFVNEEAFYYYSRKNNIWNLIYDHFFKRLYHIFDRSDISDTSIWVKEFLKAAEYCNTDYVYDILDSKPNFNFSDRKFRLTNLYNILLYEVYVMRIFKYMITLVHQNDLNSFLISWKYFWYFTNIDYSYDEWRFSEITYHNYDINWLKYEAIKNELIKDSKYYIETDIKSYYDNINHELLIEKLKHFFHKYWKLNTDDFLYTFSNILFKVNGYGKSWIPQWVIASDILANIYLWLLVFLEKGINWFKLDNWHFEIFWHKYLNYNDDYIFFGKDTGLDLDFNKDIKPIFRKAGLPLNLEKTSIVKKSSEYKFYDEIDFEKLIKKESTWEVTKLKNLILKELKKDISKIDINTLKRYFKWIHNIKYARKDIRISFAKSIFNTLFIDLKWDTKHSKIKKIYLLLVISSSNFTYLIKILEEYFQSKYSKSFEDILLNEVFRSYYYHVTDSVLAKFYSDLSSLYYNLKYTKLREFLYSIIILNNNKAIISYIIDDKKPLDLLIKDNGLNWLHDLVYRHRNILAYQENILWIKLYSLFGIKAEYSEINSYLELHDGDDRIKLVKHSLNNILDDLLIVKNISTNFYLKNPSFLSDLYSILNIFLTLLFHIRNEEIISITIHGWRESWKIIVEKKWWVGFNEDIRVNFPEFDINHIHLMYYIAKKRAVYNHKEVDIEKDIDFIIYKVNEDLNTFSNWISSLLTYILALIEKEVVIKNLNQP